MVAIQHDRDAEAGDLPRCVGRNSPKGGAKGFSTLQQRRRRHFKTRPVIDCALALKEEAVANPFNQPNCHSITQHYELFEALGQGSTGVVYRARRRADGLPSALKVMRMDDEELLRIAKEEFEILKTIDHPNIVRAIDFFTFPMGCVLALDYFPGRSLEAAVFATPEKRLAEPTARTLFAALVRAVAYLHERNIVHRDVKADNILVSANLRDLRLVDFNTARSVAEGGALTMTGTPDYLPPEVLSGASHSVGSDVWAAGLCLHFMLIGGLPFERRLFCSHGAMGQAVRNAVSPSPVLSLNQQSQPPSLFGAWGNALSAPCQAVLRSCLEINPEERPRAAQILESAWLQFVEENGEPTACA